MKEIRCPMCNKKAKFMDCICTKKGNKRIMLKFPCFHYSSLVYNVPVETDINTIVKDFESISKSYFEKSYYTYNDGDRYLERKTNHGD